MTDTEKTNAPAASTSGSAPDCGGERRSKINNFFTKKEKIKDIERNASGWSGGSDPTDGKRKEKIPPVSLRQLFRFATPFEIFLSTTGLIAAAGAGAAQPFMTLIFGNLTKSFVDFSSATLEADRNPSEQNLRALSDHADRFRRMAARDALILIFIGVGMGIATWYFMWVWGYVAEINVKRIRERYLRAVLRQEIAFFDTTGAGEVATRIQTNTHLVQMGMSEKVGIVVQYASSFFTGFILAYIRSWRLALAMSATFPCLAIAGVLMNKFLTRWTKESLDSVAEGGALAEEVIASIRTAQAFGSQQALAKMYDKHIFKAHGAEMKTAITNGFGIGSFFFFVYAAYGLAFHYGTTLVLQGHADVGIVVNVFLSILIGSFSMTMIPPEYQAITNGCAAAEKLFATIDRVPTIDSESNEGRKLEGSIRGEISFKNVVFNYPSRPDVPVLKGLSINIKAGKTTALVGASGSGKSTIVNLIERFYDPLSGSVTLDNIDLRDLNVTWLRSQIGLVSQEPTLFATTIRGNVAHGLIGSRFEHEADEVKEKLIMEACTVANIDGFVTKLPDGYDTLVGERGFLLSGGQKQRIAIARAIVSDPKILLLDEATSALDTQSEGIVQNALDKAAAGRTTITIAHRLSTVKDAHQIYVMVGGEFLEQGTHEELLRNFEGPYAKLVAAQQLRETSEVEEFPSQSPSTGINSQEDYEPAAPKVTPFRERDASHPSIVDQNIAKNFDAGNGEHDERDYSLPYLFRRMGQINKDAWRLYAYGVLGAIGTGGIFPVFGIVYARAVVAFQTIPDTEENRRQIRHDGDRNALWFFLISIAATATITSQNYFFTISAATLTGKLRRLGIRAILRQDIEYFDQEKNNTGALISNLSENPQKISGLAGMTLGAIVQAAATVVIGSIVGLIYGWKLALVGIAIIPFVFVAGYIRLRVVLLKDEANKRFHEDSAQIACEAAVAIRTIAALTRERDCVKIYSRCLDVPFKKAMRTSVFATATYAASQSMAFFAIALIFWYGSRLVANGEYSSTAFFVCLMSVTFGAMDAGEMFSYVPDVSAARGAAKTLIQLLDKRPAIDADEPEGRLPQAVRGHVVFQDVHFKYPTRPEANVLRGLDIRAEPGTYVALVGASGCGKSTAIQLLERFYDPLRGKILLDGLPIDELNIIEYRKNISLVSQEPTIYGGTIRFNILLGAAKPQGEVTQGEIEAACRNANILEFIQSLPDQFETEVGKKGAQLSGGQKQRIAIARALLRNPKVLLLDEATSALDSQSEKVVQEALDQAARGRTTIAIAHRLSTIQNADRIYFIKEGRVFESGTHEELTARRGAYHEYTQLQQLPKAD